MAGRDGSLALCFPATKAVKTSLGQGDHLPQPAFTFHSQSGCQDEGGGPTLPGIEMKRMKRFVLITLAACVAIDLLVLWMLWD
jgi:hypothetical protein